MTQKANTKLTALFVFSASLTTAALTAIFLTFYYRRVWFQLLGCLCGEIFAVCPDVIHPVLHFLKAQKSGTADTSENFLLAYGYQPSDFGHIDAAVIGIAALCFVAGSLFFLFSFWYWNKKSANRIQSLTDDLAKINTGCQGLLLSTSEDNCSKLQDEIYKTVTELYQTRDAARRAKKNYAENLSNIAHQLKTPITAMSLSVQIIKKYFADSHLIQLERQLGRLMHLEESLLLLSRIDAGTLVLNQKAQDIFTILALASDNLQELFSQAGVWADVPEMGEAEITVDLDWTMEAIMNLMKNCIEAAEAGTAVHCSYGKNPLYAQIRIWDEGQGFAKEDLPHLFERFYRGKKTKADGIGIGLPLAKAIIELQNGTISAYNLPAGGACFEIHFYSH